MFVRMVMLDYSVNETDENKKWLRFFAVFFIIYYFCTRKATLFIPW